MKLSGWPETKVVAIFTIVTALLCLVGFSGTVVFERKLEEIHMDISGKNSIGGGNGASAVSALPGCF